MPMFKAASATRALISSEADKTNFRIPKAGRFSNRVFQIVVSLGAWLFLGRQGKKLVETYTLGQVISLHWILSIFSPIVSGGLILMYLMPWFKKSWNSRKLLKVEFFFDLVLFSLWTLMFAVEVNYIGGNCPAGSSDDCNMYNWVLAWGGFSMIFWFAGICFDIWSWGEGIYGWGDRLTDSEADSVLRRLSKGTSSSQRSRRF
ncbi:hypothetical protein HK099_001801 [Clydaea vesicula]|uniref:MARVEL domain-containing protein n=1 Tax=Clydaea vesicula TaxID=447962 RepID=A0AAD5U4V6_9FUNG|nr:hypothetical protein HK099_001801 [Clydaea vesicula]KAJ3392723.1 hypothetical protein HDU92_008226 [Lobulomyces angularis]